MQEISEYRYFNHQVKLYLEIPSALERKKGGRVLACVEEHLFLGTFCVETKSTKRI